MTTTFSHLDSRSASSFRDGLGERTLVFDRVQVRTLEALHLRPELSAFAGAVTERVSMLESFRHRHYARVRQVTGDPGRLVILSDHVSGVRLSDLIDIVWSAELTLDAGSGLYLISRLLPAAADFHAATGCTHGAIAPERLVITPRGKLAIVEPMLAPALAGIGFSRDRLWREMRIGTPISRDRSTFDERTDVAERAASVEWDGLQRRRSAQRPTAAGTGLVAVREPGRADRRAARTEARRPEASRGRSEAPTRRPGARELAVQ